jgi:hypothetical protein
LKRTRHDEQDLPIFEEAGSVAEVRLVPEFLPTVRTVHHFTLRGVDFFRANSRS